MYWQTTRFQLALDRPRVMGIVNLTPDSFSDGGRSLSQALQHAQQLLADGADILDIGGESTRPGAEPASLTDELARVLPVLKAAVQLGVPVSVDTRKPALMREAIALYATRLHGRTVQQKYVGPSDWEFLAAVKRHAGERTVIGSGDLFSARACVDMLTKTGVDGVSVARGRFPGSTTL